MSTDMLKLRDLLEKAPDAVLLREMIGFRPGHRRARQHPVPPEVRAPMHLPM
jgi:hypothetical protein